MSPQPAEDHPPSEAASRAGIPTPLNKLQHSKETPSERLRNSANSNANLTDTETYKSRPDKCVPDNANVPGESHRRSNHVNDADYYPEHKLGPPGTPPEDPCHSRSTRPTPPQATGYDAPHYYISHNSEENKRDNIEVHRRNRPDPPEGP